MMRVIPFPPWTAMELGIPNRLGPAYRIALWGAAPFVFFMAAVVEGAIAGNYTVAAICAALFVVSIPIIVYWDTIFSPRWRRLVAFIVIGAGAVFLAIGIYLLAVSQKTVADAGTTVPAAQKSPGPAVPPKPYSYLTPREKDALVENMRTLSAILAQKGTPTADLALKFISDRRPPGGAQEAFTKIALVSTLNNIIDRTQTFSDALKDFLVGNPYEVELIDQLAGDNEISRFTQDTSSFIGEINDLAHVNKNGDDLQSSFWVLKARFNAFDAAATRFAVWINNAKTNINQTSSLIRAGK